MQIVKVPLGDSPPNPRECSNCSGSERNNVIVKMLYRLLYSCNSGIFHIFVYIVQYTLGIHYTQCKFYYCPGPATKYTRLTVTTSYHSVLTIVTQMCFTDHVSNVIVFYTSKVN